MDLTYNERQRMLKDTARGFFAAECPLATVRQLGRSELGYEPRLWKRMAELGWLGLTLPSTYRGGGGSFLDAYVIYEEMGRALFPSPHLATVVVAGETLLAAGSAEQKNSLLPGIAQGALTISPAVLEPSNMYGPGGIQLEARSARKGYTLQGTKLLVPYANSASHFLVAARTGGSSADGITLFLVPGGTPGLSLSPLPNIAGEKLFEVSFRGVTAPRTAVVGAAGAGWAPLSAATDKAGVLVCGMIAGACERVLEMTTEYAQRRVQFGRPIGQFQAVQSMCADIAADTRLVALLARQAAWHLDEGVPGELAVAAAKSFASRAAQRVTRLAHDVHAGVGFMLEHDLPLYTSRAKHWELALGDPRYHHEQMAEALSL